MTFSATPRAHVEPPVEYRSVHELFRSVASADPAKIAYQYKSGGQWHDVTWAETSATVDAVSKSLMALGAKHGDRVGILGQTRLEWALCDFGAVSCGAVTVGIYPSNLPPDCAYIVNHSGSEIVFVEDGEQLRKILSVRDELPRLRHIVIWDGDGDPDNDVLSWKAFLAVGESVDDADLEARAAAIEPSDLASLVYTSGTTGVPKGAMITHDNLVFTSGCVCASLLTKPHFTSLLFLPLAHVFARLIVYVCVRARVTVAFAEGFQAVAENLRETQPHFIASVPRVYEKVYGKVLGGVEDAGGLKEKLFHWALGVGTEVSKLQQAKRPIPGWLAFKHRLANRLVLHKIQAAFGGRILYTISGAAPLNKDIAEFFHACGILILEGLGMTENTSFSNVNRYDNNKFGTVGQAGPGVEVKIAEDGEVLFRGRNVMKGYFRNEEATAETIDSDGWLHSGDIGEIDDEGFLRITDRKKDLIVTAGGKNVAPQRIERILRTSHYISQVVAIGDRRKFISALITLDPETIPKWAAENGIDYDRDEDLASDSRVHELIEREIAERNRQLASFESVKTFRIIPTDLTVEGGELTASMKVKRKVVLERYGDLVEQMYAGP